MDTKRYYEIYEKTNEMVDKLIEYTKGNETINMGYGNYDSKLIIILMDQSQQDLLNVYETALSSIEMGMSDVYVTYLTKTSNNDLNISALKKELEILGNTPKYIIHDLNINLNGYDIQTMDSKIVTRFNEILNLEKKKGYTLSQDESKEKGELGNILWQLIGPRIHYAKQFI